MHLETVSVLKEKTRNPRSVHLSIHIRQTRRATLASHFEPHESTSIKRFRLRQFGGKLSTECARTCLLIGNGGEPLSCTQREHSVPFRRLTGKIITNRIM